MNKAQSFGRYIRNQEAFTNWFLWELLFTTIRTFFAAHAHKLIVLGKQCYIQDRAFHPALLDLGKMRVANADCYCRKDSCGNVVGWVVMAFVNLADDALDFCREYANRKISTR